MTVTNPSNKDEHIGDGIITNFPYTFYVADAAHMFVYVASLLVDPSEYTVTDVGNPNGGEVIFNVAPPDGDTVVLLREVPLTQLVDYREYDPFPAETHEGALDNLTYIAQQQQEQLDRASKAPVGGDPDVDYTFPPYDAGKGVMWDEVEKKFTNSNDNLNGITDAAQASADAAAASAAAASGSESAAAASAVAANNSAVAAALSETKAQEWAENPENVPVEPGQYSALHWAAKAEKTVKEEEKLLLGQAGEYDWDWADVAGERVATIVPAFADHIVNDPTNMEAGMSAVLRVRPADFVGFTLSFGPAYDWGDAEIPDFPDTDGSVYILGFYSDGTKVHSWLNWVVTV